MTRDKKSGIRAQLARRGGQNYRCSRGEGLFTERFPELAAIRLLEGTVVDGEVLVWHEGAEAPAPFAKACSGLTEAEIAQVDNAIRKSTIEKFGPVRHVAPTMVFEIGIEGIALSSRHKAGIAVRFPCILRRRDDKAVEEADTLDMLKGLLAAAAP
jgi:ATP-dependent DNA ligase